MRAAVHVGELLGVQLDAQALRGRRLEHAPGLFEREADGFAEGIDRVDQSFARQRRQHVADDLVDVFVRAAGEFRWQGVRAEERGAAP